MTLLLIEHGHEPRELQQAKGELKRTPDVDYCYKNLPSKIKGSGADPKDAVIGQLLQEQGHLCAYCMRRIDHTEGGGHPAHIEHWIPQSKGTGEDSLNYKNMLAVCAGGGAGVKKKNQTCDTYRGNDDLTIDPRNPRHIETLFYDEEGRIRSSDERIQNDLDKRLNLNGDTTLLPQNRKKALNQAVQQIYKCYGSPNADVQKAQSKIRKMIDRIERHGGYRDEYAGVVLWRLKDHLERREQR